MELKVMTYNICSGRDFTGYKAGEKRDFNMDVTLAAGVMKKYAPDIIGVNEVRGEGPGETFTEQAQTMGEFLGYRYFFGPAIRFDGGPYGNAFLTRFPILRAETILIPDPEDRSGDKPNTYYETRGIIRAELDVPGGLTVFVSHFGLGCSEQRNAVATLLDALKTVSGPVLFMGDLNMQPDDPILAPVFSALHDTAAILPSRPMTFASYQPRVKIDYIFTSDHFMVRSASPLDERVSDHRPYLAELTL